MKFYYAEKDSNLKEILIELTKQYADNFQHLGIDEYNKTIKTNLELLLIVIEELKKDSHLEYVLRKEYE